MRVRAPVRGGSSGRLTAGGSLAGKVSSSASSNRSSRRLCWLSFSIEGTDRYLARSFPRTTLALTPKPMAGDRPGCETPMPRPSRRSTGRRRVSGQWRAGGTTPRMGTKMCDPICAAELVRRGAVVVVGVSPFAALTRAKSTVARHLFATLSLIRPSASRRSFKSPGQRRLAGWPNRAAILNWPKVPWSKVHGTSAPVQCAAMHILGGTCGGDGCLYMKQASGPDLLRTT